MAYQSLYRRYRPRRFAEVRGQDTCRALRNAVREDRVGHAYLFSGPAGHGQDHRPPASSPRCSTASADDGEPCGECAVLPGHRGRHQLRRARARRGVQQRRRRHPRPDRAGVVTHARPHKVYILDEVHMLSQAAEAALLKTLEEPPPHVVFVLATTDPQKVSPTIRSRTQHLEFHLLPADELEAHVRWIAADAGLDVDRRGRRGRRRAGRRLGARHAVGARPGGRGRRRDAGAGPLDEFVES